MSRIGGLNVLWRGRPDMVALLAEPILTRLAWPVSDPYYDQDRQLALLVQSQDKAFLAAHSAALLAIVRDRLSRNTSPLLVAAVGLGADATPAVLAGLGSADMTIRIDALTPPAGHRRMPPRSCPSSGPCCSNNALTTAT